MRLIWAVVSLCLAPLAHAGTPPGSIDSFVAAELPASGAPGVAWAVVEDGKIRADARGEALAGSGTKLTPDTPFVLGSLSKSFTAMAVMQLAEAGKLDLDTGIARYLKDFAGGPAQAITIRQLLGHSSGYSTLQGNQTHQDRTGAPDELARAVVAIAQTAPAYPPGARWEYSNLNYQILGALIETLSGEDYAHYVERHILAPIGMTHSFVADGRRHDEAARGHVPWFFARRALEPRDTVRLTAPQGGVFASAGDVARYLAVMMNGADDVITAESKALMLRPASAAFPFYGLGWFIDGARGTMFHTGSSPGVETLMTMIPAQRKGAVVLVNAGSGIGFGETAPLREGIVARALGIDAPDEDGRWTQKALYAALVATPFVFLLAMIWALRHRAALRAKSGAFGLFSLWFPLLATLAMAGFLLFAVPPMFGVSRGTLALFQPDLALTFEAIAATGVAWALLRLALAYSGRRA